MVVLWVLVALLLLFAIVGGVAISKFLFFVLIVAAILALIGLFTTNSVKSGGGRFEMGVGVSLILIAVGAVLAWAVDVSTSGFNVNTVGYILLDRRHHRPTAFAGVLVELGGSRLLH